MEKLAELPDDLVFYTQITMEAAEDTEFLDAMHKAHILGALVGVEAVTPEGLKDVYKGFNLSGDALVARLKTFRRHGVHVLGSFIFGLPSDRKDTFDATVALADRSDLTFAQFVLLTPFPGTIDFEKWAKEKGRSDTKIDGVPVTRHWLIPQDRRPKLYTEHPTLSLEEIRVRTQGAWDQFYSWRRVWARSRVVKSLRGRFAFVLVLEDVSADVRQYRHRHRQRARRAIGAVDPGDGLRGSPAVPRQADAGLAAPPRSAGGYARTSPSEAARRIAGAADGAQWAPSPARRNLDPMPRHVFLRLALEPRLARPRRRK